MDNTNETSQATPDVGPAPPQVVEPPAPVTPPTETPDNPPTDSGNSGLETIAS